MPVPKSDRGDEDEHPLAPSGSQDEAGFGVGRCLGAHDSDGSGAAVDRRRRAPSEAATDSRGSRPVSRLGHNQNHGHDSPAWGYFRASPSGSHTPGNPAARSARHTVRQYSTCSASAAFNIAGTIVTCPCRPCRTAP